MDIPREVNQKFCRSEFTKQHKILLLFCTAYCFLSNTIHKKHIHNFITLRIFMIQAYTYSLINSMFGAKRKLIGTHSVY